MAVDQNQIVNQLNLIQQYLDGTIAQIQKMAENIDNMGKKIAESIAALNENLRLIIEVVKKGRSNLSDTLDDVTTHINEDIKKLWEEKTLENITQEEAKSIEKIKEINKVVSDNLYSMQLLSVVQSIREIVGSAIAVKSKKS
jgi:DNA repair exonuclease SbcCD ATPase subunit